MAGVYGRCEAQLRDGNDLSKADLDELVSYATATAQRLEVILGELQA